MASVVLHTVGTAAGNDADSGPRRGFPWRAGARGGRLYRQPDRSRHTGHGTAARNLSVQDSRYGAGIPIAYGNVRVAGNVIWSTDLIADAQNTTRPAAKAAAWRRPDGDDLYLQRALRGRHCAWPHRRHQHDLGRQHRDLPERRMDAGHSRWRDDLYRHARDRLPTPFMQSILGSGNVPAYQRPCLYRFRQFATGRISATGCRI